MFFNSSQIERASRILSRWRLKRRSKPEANTMGTKVLLREKKCYLHSERQYIAMAPGSKAGSAPPLLLGSSCQGSSSCHTQGR